MTNRWHRPEFLKRLKRYRACRERKRTRHHSSTVASALLMGVHGKNQRRNEKALKDAQEQLMTFTKTFKVLSWTYFSVLTVVKLCRGS